MDDRTAHELPAGEDEAGAGEGLFFKGNPLLALFLVKGEALAGVFTLREHRSVIGVDDTRQGWGSLEGIKEHANLKDETWSWLFNSGLLAQDARLGAIRPRCGDIVEMARAVAAAGADGISLINTFPAMAVDVETARPRLANNTGGLSGPAIHPIAVLLVWEVARALDLPVIGMGGIWSWRDAVELMMVGADAVAVGTLNFSDPAAPLGIIGGMLDFLKRKGIDSAAALVDMAHREGG